MGVPTNTRPLGTVGAPTVRSSLVLEAESDRRYLRGDETGCGVVVARLYKELPGRVLDPDCQTDAPVRSERTGPGAYTHRVNETVAASVSVPAPDRLTYSLRGYKRALGNRRVPVIPSATGDQVISEGLPEPTAILVVRSHAVKIRA